MTSKGNNDTFKITGRNGDCNDESNLLGPCPKSKKQKKQKVPNDKKDVPSKLSCNMKLATNATVKEDLESLVKSPNIQEVFDLMQSQLAARKQVRVDMKKCLNETMTELEADLSNLKEIDRQFKAFTSAYTAIIRATRTALEQRINELKEFEENFEKGYTEMETRHQNQLVELETELDKYLSEEKEQLISETKKSYKDTFKNFLQNI